MRCNRALRKLVVKIGGYRPFLDEDTPSQVTEEPSDPIEGDDSEYKDNWDEHETDVSEESEE
jgi:hypothetical protein